jgi:DNA-binding CsgD family transcriptional regulator
MPYSTGYATKYEGPSIDRCVRLSRGPTKPPKLIDRDVQWLEALSHGAPQRDLYRSEQYVKNRLRIIREIMGVQNTVQAVAEALRRGIIR